MNDATLPGIMANDPVRRARPYIPVSWPGVARTSRPLADAARPGGERRRGPSRDRRASARRSTIDDQTLSDVKLAVTEACTNAVVHAYPDGEGPLEVAAYVRDDRLMLVVRDEGRGIVPRTDSPGLGLGLPLIATLAEALELGTDDARAHRGAHDLPPRRHGGGGVSAGERPATRPRLVEVRDGPLVGAVLSRVVGMLAARALCPIDRLDDALLITDAIAAHAAGFTPNGTVGDHRHRRRRRRSRSVVSPLRADGAEGLLRAAELPGVGNVLERVADEVTTGPSDDGAGEELASDSRSYPA